MQHRFGYITADRDGTTATSSSGTTNGVLFRGRTSTTFPIVSRSELNADFGIYIQDSWQLGRLTLNPGLRFERFNAEVPEQSAPAGRFVPERHFDQIPNLPNYNNWVPRLGAAYDLSGNGKTGAQVQRRPVHGAGCLGVPGALQPDDAGAGLVSWTDLNRDDIADGALGCVYLTPGCELNFAQLPATFGVRRNRNPDADICRGPISWSTTRACRASCGRDSASPPTTTTGGSTTSPSRRISPSRSSVYTPYQIPDPRGNGQTITVYNIDPAALRTLERAGHDVVQQHVGLPQLRYRHQHAVAQRRDSDGRNGERPVAGRRPAMSLDPNGSHHRRPAVLRLATSSTFRGGRRSRCRACIRCRTASD